MPWLSIIMWLVSFLLSKSSGASTTKSALIATGVGLGTYYLADPSNPDNLLGIGLGDGAKTTPGDTSDDAGASAAAGFGTKALSEVGSTLRSWGPAGTLGVVAGTTAISQVNSKWLLIGGAAVLAILLLK